MQGGSKIFDRQYRPLSFMRLPAATTNHVSGSLCGPTRASRRIWYPSVWSAGMFVVSSSRKKMLITKEK